jgi:hypothetical protein
MEARPVIHSNFKEHQSGFLIKTSAWKISSHPVNKWERI